jgi:hypothetical protein
MSSLLWIFGIFDAGALLMLLDDARRRHGLATRVRPALASGPAIALVVAAYFAQLALALYAARHQALPLPPHALVPLPLASGVAAHQNAVVAAMIALSALQTFALLQLYRGNPPGIAVTVACAAIVVASLLSPVMISADLYAYVADGLLGIRAYSPPNVPFVGTFAPIDAWWSIPMPPTPYGPLWIFLCALLGAPFPTLLGRILALRVLGAVAFLALVAALRALRVPRRLVVVAALNPGLAFAFIASGHNDLLPVSLIAWGAYAARRRPVFAAVLLSAAGLIKLPLAFFGLPVLSNRRDNVVRAALGLGAIVAAAAITYAVGGSGYLRAAATHATSSPFMTVMTAVVGIAVVIAIFSALAGRRRYRAVVWLIPLSSAYTLPSYLAWSVPYALARRNLLGYLLVAFPTAATLVDVKFMTPWSLLLVVPLVFAWQIVPLRRRRLR